jgi:hypothetical protein
MFSGGNSCLQSFIGAASLLNFYLLDKAPCRITEKRLKEFTRSSENFSLTVQAKPEL